MKILVVGSGGREHALAWKIGKSPHCSKLFCAPGNAGTLALGENIPLSFQQADELIDFAVREKIDLAVIGPDDALAGGIVDRFSERGLQAFGPTREAARFESSKVFAKEFMHRHGIPTAGARSFSDYDAAIAFLNEVQFPVAVKADGLALGKGVILASDAKEASQAIAAMLKENRFGAAGSTLLIEEFLTGTECSIHAVFDDSGYLLFPPAQDHKRAFDGDQGPNTGGMGTFSPPPAVDAELMNQIDREILRPFFAGTQKEGIGFKGTLFPGLMLTAAGPKVLEFNCRFGDPETQALLPRLESDLVEILLASVENRIDQCEPQWDPRTAVCVVMASGGYPSNYEKGKEITGTDLYDKKDSIQVFHAGTKQEDGRLLTAGGRVLGVTALGDDLQKAREEAYAAVSRIHFEEAHYRRDIGLK